jgi:NAD(P)H-hydrate epimerase
VAWSNEKAQAAPRQALIPNELAGLLPRRNALSYKGDFGKLAIVAGSLGFTGAPVLCAQAAQATGVGLLSICTHADAARIIAAHAPPEAMVSGWEKLDKVPDVVREASAIVLGPGLAIAPASSKMVFAILKLGIPTVVDADALTALTILNDLGKHPNLLRDLKTPLILTPHIGEMVRLTFRKFTPDERESVAREFVEHHRVTLVLKGTRTLVTSPGQPFFINTTGNPGLSTGGSGDTLSGILGALLAQGLAPIDAARLGVWLHGHAADLVLADRGCEEGLTPTMLSAYLGKALVSLRRQAVASAGLIERTVS